MKLVDFTGILCAAPSFSSSSIQFVFLSRFVDKQLVLRCEIKVPLDLAFLSSTYKYVLIHKDNEVEHEWLIEFTPWRGEVVDRCLVVEKECAMENSKLTDNFMNIFKQILTLNRFETLVLMM